MLEFGHILIGLSIFFGLAQGAMIAYREVRYLWGIDAELDAIIEQATKKPK